MGHLDIRHLDLIQYRQAIAPTITVNEEIRVMIVPNLPQDPIFHINGLSPYNMSKEETKVKKAIAFENISSVLAVPVQPDKILRKASLHQNVLNFSFLDVLTKLLFRIDQQEIT